jgi:pyruvate kinase
VTRRTKIVATIGPASRDEAVIGGLVAAGIDAARVNFSHGTVDEHAETIARVRSAAAAAERPVAIVCDLPGPKLRVGRLQTPVPIAEGQQVALGVGGDLPLTEPELILHAEVGHRVLLDDGALALTVTGRRGDAVLASALNPGVVSSHKGVNLPDTSLSIPALTARDRDLLRFAVAHDVDYVALSFVRQAQNVLDLKAALRELGGRQQVIAKIEKAEALAAIDGIVAAADAVMVARGDLGVEIAAAQVPIWQKRIIHACIVAGRPVITATQMLQSMVVSPRPTRAEASDVANAIYDATDAVMLSAETAVGQYPVEAVRTMADIALTIEADIAREGRAPQPWAMRPGSVTDAISYGACEIGRKVDATALVTATTSGATTRAVAKHRPSLPLVAVSPDAGVVRQLSLVWGVVPLLGPAAAGFESMVTDAEVLLRRHGLAASGDVVVVTAGMHAGRPGTTNLIKAHRLA